MSASLSNFPHISQRDGDINSVDDCVAACVAMGLEYLTGNKYTAGQVKDAVYGTNYTGGTAAIAYEQYCSGQGVILSSINGNGQQLVNALKTEIAAGHPCIVTEPDPYEAGWSHCCAAYAFNSDAANITVVDPWIDQDVTKSDATWAAQLLYSQIWTLKKASTQGGSMIPAGWSDDGHTLIAPNGHKVVLGFRDKVLAGWDPANVPLEEEHHQEPLEAYFGQPDNVGQQQVFLFCILNYNQSRGVYVMGVGNEFLGQRAEIAKLQAAPPPAANVANAISKLQGALKDLGA